MAGGTIDDFCGERRHTNTFSDADLLEAKDLTEQALIDPMDRLMRSWLQCQLEMIEEEIEDRGLSALARAEDFQEMCDDDARL